MLFHQHHVMCNICFVFVFSSSPFLALGFSKFDFGFLNRIDEIFEKNNFFSRFCALKVLSREKTFVKKFIAMHFLRMFPSMHFIFAFDFFLNAFQSCFNRLDKFCVAHKKVGKYFEI